jgi:hypothetical protein
MLTRRGFVERIAAAGGASLAYDAMAGLGLIAAPRQTPFALRGEVKDVRVAIVGAGLAERSSRGLRGQLRQRLPLSTQGGGTRRQARSPARGAHDLDGYVAELLSKAISGDALNQELTVGDRERLLDYLKRNW